VEAAEEASQTTTGASTPKSPQAAPAPSNGKPVAVDPDLDFIRTLRKQGGATLKKCFQCGTCTATCTLTPDEEPFPRKEMAWAVWGMKDRLLTDPDVWLCHQCQDCSTRCPRGARPGEVLSAVRQQSVIQFAFPRFLARWVSQPVFVPLLLGIPVALLGLALAVRHPIENALGFSSQAGDRIIFAYSSLFPHWLLNSFFGLFSLLALLAMIIGALRFWRAMKGAVAPERLAAPAKAILPSVLSVLKGVITHEKFSQCKRAGPRFVSHALVLFGFLALTMVTLWVITAKINPLIQGEFVYPFSFWSPWKVLANLGGIAVVAGCLLMARDRLRNDERFGAGSYFDWALLSALLLVAISGFITEVLHYQRLEPHRHIAYFMHLVFVFAVLIYLPYSKLAHMVYRAVALVFAEHTGRKLGTTKRAIDSGRGTESEVKDHAGVSAA
jgi:quinone-modifying oxidoreductase subunit QmoC